MRILKKQRLEDILFIDIETAPLEEELTEESLYWDSWVDFYLRNIDPELNIKKIKECYKSKAALYAEFARVVCVTIGALRGNKLYIKSFNDKDEFTLLQKFNESITQFVNNKTLLCGHAVKAFDAPFLMKRLLVNRVELPLILDIAHLKPWETSYLDTADLWKGTSFKASSLLSIMTAMGLPSPKDDMSGSQVGQYFYEGRIDEITAYCEKDVKALVDLIAALRGEEPFELAEAKEEKKEPVGVLEYIFMGGDFTPEIKQKLIDEVSKMNKTDKARAAVILNALPSKAKGKTTFISKKDVKDIITASDK